MLKMVIIVCAVLTVFAIIKKKAKRVAAAGLAVTIGVASVAASSFVHTKIQAVGENASALYDTIDINDVNAPYYEQFVTPHPETTRTSLLLGMDASGKRPDMILLLVSSQKSVVILSIPRDTLVKIPFSNHEVCKLSEAWVLNGEENKALGFVHVMQYNFGIAVNHLSTMTMSAVPSLINHIFGEIEIDMNDIEVCGLNQTAANTAECCNGAVKDFAILDEHGEVMFRDELAWLCQPENFCHHFENGIPVDEDGTPTGDRCEKLYKINELFEEYNADFAPLSEESRTYSLSGEKVICYLRMRHPFSNQASTRSKNAAELMTSLVLRFIQILTLDENAGENIQAFADECARNGYIRTSYSSWDEIERDLLLPLRPISFGKTIDGRKFNELPYYDPNYGDVLTGKYVSLIEMAADLVYGEGD